MSKIRWIGLVAGLCLPALVTIGCGPSRPHSPEVEAPRQGYAHPGPTEPVALPPAEPKEPRDDVVTGVNAPQYAGWPFDSAEAVRRQRETASRLGVETTRRIDLGGGVSLDLVLIPAGEFDMGSPANEDGRESDEGPVRRVTLTQPYWLGRTEVTQAQWEAVMGNDPSQFDGDDRPVERVSWNDAQDFCRRLSQRSGLRVGLPTEAQWEYACRGGSNDRYSFGDSESSLSRYAWYDGNSNRQTHPVAGKQPNAWGLYDMHGNVWEWCSDWYADSYANANTVDPQGSNNGTYRVLRGGCWINDARYCRSAPRYWLTPDLRLITNGFRVSVDFP